MSKIPNILTKNQAIAYALTASHNFINSGNINYFDIGTFEIFMNGAMEVHNKSKIVKFSKNIKINNKAKMIMKIEKIKDMTKIDM